MWAHDVGAGSGFRFRNAYHRPPILHAEARACSP